MTIHLFGPGIPAAGFKMPAGINRQNVTVFLTDGPHAVNTLSDGTFFFAGGAGCPFYFREV